MSADVNAIRVATEFADVPHRPRERSRHILDLRREFVFRAKSITRDHRGDSLAGVTIAQRRILRAIAGRPRAAMDEKENRRVCFLVRQINVELVLRFILRLSVGISEAAFHDDVRFRLH